SEMCIRDSEWTVPQGRPVSNGLAIYAVRAVAALSAAAAPTGEEVMPTPKVGRPICAVTKEVMGRLRAREAIVLAER
ncbi:hypothetical protein, partial [Streptomyces resistomycificus]|uniref:hypothetical protein n=1 Tax=Streptomyces resistomycificus TaxID=67356 RepID=UPI001ADF029F